MQRTKAGSPMEILERRMESTYELVVGVEDSGFGSHLCDNGQYFHEPTPSSNILYTIGLLTMWDSGKATGKY